MQERISWGKTESESTSVKKWATESYRLHEDVFRRGFDIVVVARVSAKERTFREIESAFLHLGRLHHLVEKEEHESNID